MSIVSDFQHLVTPGATDWDPASALPMQQTKHPNGLSVCLFFRIHLFLMAGISINISCGLKTPPCAMWVIPAPNTAAIRKDRSAFVLGGLPVDPKPIAQRLASGDLIIYELMIDDFTKEYRGSSAPIDAVQDKLDLVQPLNINAIEFMPWIAWPDDVGFSWGYNPAYFFSVESAYVSDAGSPLNRLSKARGLITECHRRKIHVLLDIVLQHAYQGSDTNGFPYYWLWQTPTDSPFVGVFEPASNFSMLPLDYNNPARSNS